VLRCVSGLWRCVRLCVSCLGNLTSMLPRLMPQEEENKPGEHRTSVCLQAHQVGRGENRKWSITQNKFAPAKFVVTYFVGASKNLFKMRGNRERLVDVAKIFGI